MHAGTADLTLSGTGSLVIGANQELVVIGNDKKITIDSKIVDNDGGASSLTYSGAGILTLSGTVTFTGSHRHQRRHH